MTKDEALRLALEALKESLYATTAKSQHLAFEAITAIKAALEAKDEPVAWRWGVPKLKHGTFEWRYSVNKTRPDAIPLYTAPQKQPPVIDKSVARRIATQLGWEPKRKSLREEMVKQMKLSCDSMEMRGAFADGWLSAEAAHGIKGEA